MDNRGWIGAHRRSARVAEAGRGVPSAGQSSTKNPTTALLLGVPAVTSPDMAARLVQSLSRTANPGIFYDPRQSGPGRRVYVAKLPKPAVHRFSDAVLRENLKRYAQRKLAKTALGYVSRGAIRLPGLWGLAAYAVAIGAMAYLDSDLGGDIGPVAPGGWSWPDPADYFDHPASSWVQICEDAAPEDGPFGSSPCGSLNNFAVDQEPFVDEESGGGGVDAISWAIYDRILGPDSTQCEPAVRARYSWADAPGSVPPEDYPLPTLEPGYAEGGAMPGSLSPDGNPDPWPQIDPMLDPPLRPKPRRINVPYRMIPYIVTNPFRSPLEQSSRSYYVVPPPGEVEAEVSAEPSGMPPWKVPVLRWTSDSPEWKLGGHRLAKPGRKTRERKLTLSQVGGAFLPLINGVTESMDFIDALYWALPKSVRVREWREGGHYLGGYGGLWGMGRGDRDRRDRFGRPNIRYLGPHEKAEVIWRYLDHMDWEKALKNIFYNAVQDLLIGKASKETVKRYMRAQKGRVRPLSPELGPAL